MDDYRRPDGTGINIREILENMRDLYCESDTDGTILEISPSVKKILGYEPEEVTGKNITMLYAEPGSRRDLADRIAVSGKEDNTEVVAVTKDGGRKILWINAHVVTDFCGSKKIIGIARDVTEPMVAKARQEKAENELKRLSDVFEAIIESTDDLIWSVDRKGRNIYSNIAMIKHMKGSYNADYKSGIRPCDVFEPKLAEEWDGYYERAVRDGRYKLDYKTVKGEKYLEISFNPIYRDGEVTEISIFAKNITERKLAEQEVLKLNSELEQRVVERTAELQTAVSELEAFTYTVSHDLKSPLRAIEAYSRIMLEDYPEHQNDEIGEISGNIKNISKDMIALINKLLQYSTAARRDINMESVDIDEMIRAIFNELTAAMPERRIELVLESVPPRVQADRILLQQVLYNIISNAVKFTKTRETAVIKLNHTVCKNQVVFSISDNGVGFDMESAGKLFGIFQRLHTLDEYEGTGIGLATVRKIIEKHAGKAWIEGIPDQGATVYFTLYPSKD